MLGMFCQMSFAVSTNICRHYVAFVKKQIPQSSSDGWVLFNDEKVAQAVDAEEMKKFAYVYFFRRDGA